MITNLLWPILGIITIILLIIFWRTRNAIWGGFTIGIIIGFIIAIFYLFKGNGFNWSLIAKGAISGAMVGSIAELLGKISDSIKKSKIK